MRKVIAVDFDGTLFENAWPGIGAPRVNVIAAVLREQQNGAALILWTCRTGEALRAALKACEAQGLHFDAVNDSLPEWKESFAGDPRKIGATEYWDDRAVNPDRDMWVCVEDRLPETEEEVRLFCVTPSGYEYQCQGIYVPPGLHCADSQFVWDWECCEEYDAERDDYIVNPGWYERIYNWDEYSACGISDRVTHWMPLPKPPATPERKVEGVTRA